MSSPFVAPQVRRSLSAVYRFYDAFFTPFDDATPPIASPLDVSIPALRWTALRSDNDLTYRFSALTMTQPAPTGLNLEVQVTATKGDYVSLDPILVTLPLPLSVPVLRSDFLIPTTLWPTVALRPGETETAVRGQIRSASAQPVVGLKVQMWTGGITPPLGTPFTRSDIHGEFLFRFPLLKGTPGTVVPFRIRLNDGAVAVSPATFSKILGRTQTFLFDRS